MWTIVKSVLRFFKTAKMSIIGLFLLIFFSSSIFTVLNNTNLNLKNSYNSISKNGNLHDFVVNENFSLGFADFQETKNTGSSIIKYVPSTENNISNWTGSYQTVRSYYYDSNNFQKFPEFLKYFEFTVDVTGITDPSVVESTKQEALKVAKNRLTEFTNKQIRVLYDEQLQQLPVTFRRFESININNTKQNLFYKVVETDPDYTIDKLVYYRDGGLYRGDEKLSKPSNIFDDIFVNFEKDTKTHSRILASYLNKADWSNQNAQKEFLALWTYIEQNPNFDPYTQTNVLNGDAKKGQTNLIKFANSILGKNRPSDKHTIINKGFLVSFTYDGLTGPVTGSVYDYSSYEIVIGPEYLKKSNKKIYSYEEWKKHMGDSKKEFDNWFKTIPDTYKIYIDNTAYLIIGTGISPDFMYPVVSFQSVVPNKEKEQVVYVNKNGYERIYDAFRGNEIEAFIVGKFNSDVKDKQKVLNDINLLSTRFMSWPSNITPGYFADDLNNTLSPTALRLQFIPQIVNTTTVVSVFLTSFVLGLSIFVSIVIIRRFIELNRNSLGIMQANGYRKTEIILGICILVGIPTLLASIFGYLTGFFLQSSIISLLGGFWTVPTILSPFSIGLLILVCFGILLIFMALCVVFSYIALKGETSEFMKDEAKYKMSRIAESMKKPFQKFSIVSRFKASIAFLSLWRLIILSVMSAALMLSLTFSMASYNRFNVVAYKSFEPRNYSYALNLATPTIQGGQYYAVPYNVQGMTLNKNIYFNTDIISDWTIDVIDQKYTDVGGPYSSYTDLAFRNFVDIYGNYQLVSVNDNTEQKTNLEYLKYKTTAKAFTDINLGIGNLSSNPWGIAERLMPQNNANYAQQQFINMFYALSQDKNPNNVVEINNKKMLFSEALNSFTRVATEKDSGNTTMFPTAEVDANGNTIYRVFDNSKIAGGLLKDKLNENFAIFLYTVFANENYKEYQYNINYNKLVINPGCKVDPTKNDEPYTHVDFNISKINDKVVNLPGNYQGIGINSNTKKLFLKDNNKNEINYLLNKDAEIVKGKTYYPVIINEFARKKLGLKVNDILEIKITNTSDRFSRQHFKETNPSVPDAYAYLKVVGITTTYQGEEFYLSRYDANKMTGLIINNISPPLPQNASEIKNSINWPNQNGFPKKSEFVNERSGFNGVFSSYEDLPEVTKGVSIYSPSGIYISTDKIENNSTVRSIFSSKGNLEKIKNITGVFDTIPTVDSAIETIKNVFGESSQYAILSQADSKNALIDVFNNLSYTTSNIQNIILLIIIFVSLLIVILISSMIISDSIKLASILKCLGYPDDKNASAFLAVYFPVFLIGLIIAVPFSLLINITYVDAIFSFAGILLTIPMVWWHYLVSSISVIIIFLCSYWIAWYRIKKMNLTRAIK